MVYLPQRSSRSNYLQQRYSTVTALPSRLKKMMLRAPIRLAMVSAQLQYWQSLAMFIDSINAIKYKNHANYYPQAQLKKVGMINGFIASHVIIMIIILQVLIMMCENYNKLAMRKQTTAILGIILAITSLLLTVTAQNTQKDIPKFTFIEVYPSALDVMIHAFDQVLLYVHDEPTIEDLETYLKQIDGKLKEVKELFPNDHTLFAYLNKTNDFKGVLKRYGLEKGLKLINTFHNINYNQEQDFVQFYTDNVHPKLPLIYRSDLKKQKAESAFNLVFQYSSTEDLNSFNIIYEKIRNFVVDFNTKCFAIANTSNNKSSISLYKGQNILNSYSFFNRTQKEVAEQLVQAINIDTLPTLITIDQSTFSRVFGGSVSDQLIFIHKDLDNLSPNVLSALEQYEKAANYNRFESLAYQRVFFTKVDSKFFVENFNEDIDTIFKNSSAEYVIYFTKTDYDRFQLKKYRFQPQNSSWESQQILQFIEDVRYKRLDPEYKSQPIPSEQSQNNQILRKIVGKSFISEVYERPDQSIVILFIDSKDEQSYSRIKSLLQQFTVKYKNQIEEKLILATFDLDKNEHKLLYLKQAPQLILFDKSNKKQTKYIKIHENISLDELSQEIKKAVTNVQLEINNDM